MKICFWCDLHLPFDKNALGYDVLDWAIDDVTKKKADVIAYAGDVTCDGSEERYKEFVEKTDKLPMPALFIPGNSDLRDESCAKKLHAWASPCKNKFGDTTIYALNDADLTLTDEEICLLGETDEKSIVFMHHPIESLLGKSKDQMLLWRETHKDTMLFFGHCHKSFKDGNSVSLQAMDPDKSIGESPCITYYDTETKAIEKSYFFCAPPTDIYDYFGISCYRALEQIEYATEKKLSAIELRPGFLSCDRGELVALIEKWRNAGGKNLSIHLPDVSYADGKAVTVDNFDQFIDAAIELGADRFTQHVPKISVQNVRDDADALTKIAKALCKGFNRIDKEIEIGIENMHMTASENSDASRRFGYVPEECLEFMNIVSLHCKHRVGINFDIGHARNNAPFSQKYQVGTWLSLLGKHIVGYHIHQVTLDEDGFHNHCCIDDVYGRLISYASFFRYWSECRINKVPVVFEMSKPDAYDITLKTFEKSKQNRVTDLHSHTYYSDCGKDLPDDLVKTAITNGISVLGISDHNYGIGQRKREYISEIRQIAEKYKDRIKVLCGIEITTLPHNDIHTLSEVIKEFDYCLLENVNHPQSIVGDKLFEYAKELDIPCIIAHTDLFAWCKEKGFDYEEFFTKMAQHNIFWEMNVNYDRIHGYREHSYVKDFIGDKEKINLIKKCGVGITIGFDCHAFEDYDGFRVHLMNDTLKAMGINLDCF